MTTPTGNMPKHQAKIYSHFYPLWGIAFARVLGYPYSQKDSTVMLSAAKHLDAHPLSPYGILDLCLRLMHIGRPWCQPTEGAASPSLTSATSSYS